jgi:CheY-like chemotaxis protein
VLGAGLWLVKVDPDRLESAILNLSVNARDAMLPAGQCVLAAVSDTGAGLTRQNPFDAGDRRDGQDQPVSLLFTDVVMPEMSGRELADRAHRTMPGLKVLYTTGYTRDAIVHNRILDPGTNLMTKPFTIDELAMKIRRLLDL